MPRGRDIGAALKKRVEASAAESAQNEQYVNEVYEVIMGGKTAEGPTKVQRECRAIPVNKFRNFFTAQIGFRPYSEADLHALAEDIQENGLLDYGIVRPIPNTDEYEVLSGMSRKDACILIGWDVIPFNVEECDDARAIVIATVTNLKRRQGLLHSERGWAYRALLDAQRCQGKRTDLGELTSVEIQQKLCTRDKVAQVFGVTAHVIQRDIRLTYLIQPLLDAVDKKDLPMGCGTTLAGYDEASQQIFYDLWQETQKIPPKLMSRLKKDCPPPTFSAHMLKCAWETAQENAIQQASPKLPLSFDRRRFEAIISKLGDEKELEQLFTEFLSSRT